MYELFWRILNQDLGEKTFLCKLLVSCREQNILLL